MGPSATAAFSGPDAEAGVWPGCGASSALGPDGVGPPHETMNAIKTTAASSRRARRRGKSSHDFCDSFCNMAILLIRALRSGRNALAGQLKGRRSCLRARLDKRDEINSRASCKAHPQVVGCLLLLKLKTLRHPAHQGMVKIQHKRNAEPAPPRRSRRGQCASS